MPDDIAVRRRLNKELVRRYKLEILNGRRLAAVGEVAAEDYLDHAAFPGQSQGLAGFRDRLEMIIRAFGLRWTILDLVVDADTAVVRWALTEAVVTSSVAPAKIWHFSGTGRPACDCVLARLSQPRERR